MAASSSSLEERRRRGVHTWHVLNFIGYGLFIIPFAWLGVYLGQPQVHVFHNGYLWLQRNEFSWRSNEGSQTSDSSIVYEFHVWLPSLVGVYLKSVQYSVAILTPLHDASVSDSDPANSRLPFPRLVGDALCSGSSTDVLVNSEITVPDSFTNSSSIETCVGMRPRRRDEDFDYTDGRASALLLYEDEDFFVTGPKVPSMLFSNSAFGNLVVHIRLVASVDDLLYKYTQHSCQKLGSVSWGLAVYNLEMRHIVPLGNSSLNYCAVTVQSCAANFSYGSIVSP